jgi:hypothetical protein
MNMLPSTLRQSFICPAALSTSLIACGLQADLPQTQADAGGQPAADAGGQPAVDAAPVPIAAIDLPTADPCRDVLASFAMALGTAYGTAAPTAIVSLVEENVDRVYAIRIEARSAYWLTLSNDSSSGCAFGSLRVDPLATLAADARSRASTGELALRPQISTSEAKDACAITVGYLTQALAQSMVALDATGANATWKRDAISGHYSMRVNGKDFIANNQVFPNDFAFAATLNPRCMIFDVQDIRL